MSGHKKCSNAFFYFKMLELVKIKMRLKEMLREALDYRSCSLESQYGMIHSEGAHLDFLLAVLLFENGNIERSIQYFEIIKEKYENEEMKKYYFALIKRVIDGVTNLSDCNQN